MWVTHARHGITGQGGVSTACEGPAIDSPGSRVYTGYAVALSETMSVHTRSLWRKDQGPVPPDGALG